MIKVGIVGTENSHAMAFAKYFNLPDEKTGKVPYDEIRVTAVCGSEKSVNAIREAVGDVTVCQSAEEMSELVDAVMIVNQKGSEHYGNAMPFVRKGMPLFVDKPFTSDMSQAEELYAQIEKYGCKVMGGSGLKYASGLLEAAELAKELRADGSLVSASMNFIMVMDSGFDGIFFYAPHLVEMCTTVFGQDMRSVQAIRQGSSMMVLAEYENDSVTLHFNRDGLKYATMLYTTKDYYCIDSGIDIFRIYDTYAHEAGLFAEMLLGREEPLPKQMLLKPVQIVSAIERSLETGLRVEI